MNKKIFRLDILFAEEHYEQVCALLSLRLAQGWEEQSLSTGGTRFRMHCEDRNFLLSLLQELGAYLGEKPESLESSLTEIEMEDWTLAWREFFTPVPCGERFVVLPPWLAQSADWPERWPILIEPKSAFGTGHHASTALCLTALSDLLDSGRLHHGQSFLDLGCGSGVLGIACVRGGLHGLGLDIDPLAIANARENLELNQISGLTLAQGSIEKACGQTFDLLVANILARPLREMAGAICAALAPRGILLLSGILESQAQEVEEAFCTHGLPKARQIAKGEWRVLLWE